MSAFFHQMRSILRRLDKFACIKNQLESLDRETVQQVDDACKEITRNCELLVILKADLDTIYAKLRQVHIPVL